MKVYLVQHGEAKDKSLDPERSLTENGIFEVEKIADFLKGKLKIHKIYHSGKKRALQTAEIIGESLKCSIEEAKMLDPLDDIGFWYERILKEKQDIMIVGHLPYLEKLASRLICNDESKKVVIFRYSGVLCIEKIEDERFGIKWYITPELLK